VTIESINSNILKNMFIAGAKFLESKKTYVDELNVFPVPDGDTGTNMSLTILAAAREVEKVQGSDMESLAKAISSGSLRGARGNSGVILSQLFRGFAKEIGPHQELTTSILATAMQKGVETAYKAVMKPKEGTILTVARGAADKASELAIESDDIVFVLEEVIKYADEVLEKTPDMLPVLKEAGVVDAGGQGLIYILMGALMALKQGGEVSLDFNQSPQTQSENSNAMQGQGATVHADAHIEFGYCTEFIIDTGDKNTIEQNEQHANTLKIYLETLGDSIVAVADDDLIKIHVHTNDPGLAMQKGLTIGQLMNIKIDNMRFQHSERVYETITKPLEHQNLANAVNTSNTSNAANASNESNESNASMTVSTENAKIDTSVVTTDKVNTPMKEFAFIAVSVGAGLNDIFKSLGVDYIVTGGQTMNPSTEDFLVAVEGIHAKDIYIFPNNKNIILAASQVQDLVQDKNIIVVPSKSAPQGVSALISFDPSSTAEENLEAMNEAMASVKTGQVTFAVRDTSYDSLQISEGDIIGIDDTGIKSVHKELVTSTQNLLDKLIDEKSELVTIYYGDEVSEDDAQEIADYVTSLNDSIEVEVHFGGQPLYYYIISVE